MKCPTPCDLCGDPTDLADLNFHIPGHCQCSLNDRCVHGICDDCVDELDDIDTEDDDLDIDDEDEDEDGWTYEDGVLQT